jgi:hypothetical protein|tara:strand:+ start:87 stop:791 length:705 start_codon:yes stop_codon:yes gene_type:complete
MGRNTLIIFYSLVFFLLLTTFAVGADKIARVLEKDGRVTLTREQRSIQISRGEWLYKKDKIRTGKKSSVELKLVDGSLVNIGELGDVSLLDLVFDPIKKDGFIDLKIATGAFRMISGNIAKLGPDLMKLELPAATIGIRGTSLVGKASKLGVENFVILVPDPNGYIGELVVKNTEGIVVLTKANEGVTMIFPDRKLAKKKYTKKFVQELIRQVPKIKHRSLHDRQFNSLFWLNN